MRAYHFLSSEHGLSNIALSRMKVARFSDLNDPFELLSVSLGRGDLRRAILPWKEQMSKTKGLLCFSRQWESPILWSHYGAKHRGMCLGFEINNAYVEEVEYVGQRIPPAESESDPIGELDEAFIKRLLRTKYEHWKYEDEVRVFASLDERTVENGMYFYPFSSDICLREVILGPLCELPIEAVRSMIASIYEGVEVIKAALAYKWFAVVPSKRYRSGPSP